MSDDSEAEHKVPLDNDGRHGGNNDHLKQSEEEEEEVEAEQVSLTPLELTFLNIAKDNKEMLGFIAEGSSFQDLKNFRLASKFLYNASLKVWRRKTIPRIDFRCACSSRGRNQTPANPLFLLYEANRFVVGLEERNEGSCLLKLHDHPYQGINIYGFSCPAHGAPNDELITQFFGRMNTVLNHIVLESCSSNDSPRILEHLTEAANLKSVVFKNCEAPWRIDDDARINIMAKHLTIDPLPTSVRVLFGFDQFTWMIFYHFPALQTLTLHLTSRVTPANRGFINGLRNYRDHTEKNSLRLKIVGITNFEGTITEFICAEISLEMWVVLAIRPGFENMLLNKSLKLVKLTIAKDSKDESDTRAFPFHVELPVLKKLYLFGNVTTSFNFLRFMPALEKVVVKLYDQHETLLNINSIPGYRRNDNFVRNMPVQKKFDEIENLTYLDVDCYLDLDGLVILHEKAPKLNVLRTALRNNKMFQFVCDKWELLTDLVLYPGSAVDDSEIPKLTRLKYLMSFKIWNRRMLTDACVYDGFLKLEKLNKLGIYCPNSISEECKELLRTRIGEVKFDGGKTVRNKRPQLGLT